jgi:hypothetical protein
LAEKPFRGSQIAYDDEMFSAAPSGLLQQAKVKGRVRVDVLRRSSLCDEQRTKKEGIRHAGQNMQVRVQGM